MTTSALHIAGPPIPTCQICGRAALHSVAFDECSLLPRGDKALGWYPVCNLCLPREQERMRHFKAYIKGSSSSGQ
jgi:hypothetical protein